MKLSRDYFHRTKRDKSGNNFNAVSYDATRLSVERATIYDPGSLDWQFAHAPSITFFKGNFYAVFSNGQSGEDEGKQRIVLSKSSNFTTWTTPTPLASTTSGYVLTSGGIYVATPDTLVVFYTRNDNAADLSRPNPNLFAMYTTDGVNWSSPIDLAIPVFPSHKPTKLLDGRLILTSNRDFYYTSDVKGLSGWTKSGKSNFLAGQSAILVEGAIIQNTDSIYTLFRDVGKNMLWQESSKDGVDWGAPTKSNFTDNNTKSHFGKLPNGKYYYVGTPDSTYIGSRTPLVLSLSDDGFNFNQNYIIAADYYQIKYTSGRYKVGQFGYPSTMIHDGYLYVIVSRMKEKVEAIRVNLNSLEPLVPMAVKELSGMAQLDGTKLPLNAGWTTGNITDANSASLTAQGEIRINCAANKSYSFKVTPSTTQSFNPTGDYTVEFKLKVVSNNGRGIDIYLPDGVTAAPLVCVSTDKVYLNTNPIKVLYTLDGTQYHTYRLVIKRNENLMYLFIDGNFVTHLIRSPNTASRELLFGKSNGGAVTEAYLDYLAYDLTGAYKPVTTPLPVILKSFNVLLKNKGVGLDWESSSEINNAQYIIEKSSDGISFERLVSLATKESLRYNYFDANPYQGNNYYRLSQIDYDGKSSILGMKVINNKYLSKGDEIYPNPVKSGGSIIISSLDKDSSVEIYNSSGVLVKKLKNLEPIIVPDKPGVYVIVFKRNNALEKRKLIIQ